MMNMAQLRADTIEAANAFVGSKGKNAIAVSPRDERPIPGFPVVEHQFRLADPGTVEDSPIVLKLDRNISIQRDHHHN